MRFENCMCVFVCDFSMFFLLSSSLSEDNLIELNGFEFRKEREQALSIDWARHELRDQ